MRHNELITVGRQAEDDGRNGGRRHRSVWARRGFITLEPVAPD
jgi:hypothetical protein